jgi:hypothetical protein
MPVFLLVVNNLNDMSSKSGAINYFLAPKILQLLSGPVCACVFVFEVEMGEGFKV